MTQRRTPRQQVIVDRELRIKFAEKCLKERLITSRTNVKKVMEILMRMYLDGMLDHMIPKEKLEKRKSDNITRVQLNRKLKNDFEFRAYDTGKLISDPSFGVRALELLMNMYLDGKIKIEREE